MENTPESEEMEEMENIPAAQYVRVSTERQEYSIDCQLAEISKYAHRNGFEIVHTYCDLS